MQAEDKTSKTQAYTSEPPQWKSALSHQGRKASLLMQNGANLMPSNMRQCLQILQTFRESLAMLLTWSIAHHSQLDPPILTVFVFFSMFVFISSFRSFCIHHLCTYFLPCEYFISFTLSPFQSFFLSFIAFFIRLCRSLLLSLFRNCSAIILFYSSTLCLFHIMN